jgi:hypothetical protein
MAWHAPGMEGGIHGMDGMVARLASQIWQHIDTAHSPRSVGQVHACMMRHFIGGSVEVEGGGRLVRESKQTSAQRCTGRATVMTPPTGCHAMPYHAGRWWIIIRPPSPPRGRRMGAVEWTGVEWSGRSLQRDRGEEGRAR